MKMDLDDPDDWVRVKSRSPDRGGKPPRFQDSKLFMAKNARRGGNFRVEVPDGVPKFVFLMGYTQRRGIGADSRTAHRGLLRGQAQYNGRDGAIGWAFSFDKNGPVDRVWHRVEEWEDDKRYFRASLNPLNHEAIKDWQRFGADFMETLQHGSERTFGSDGQPLHWHSDGLLTDEDRAAKKEIDWVMSIHRETGRTHAHVLFRGTLGNDDLYIEPKATRQFWIMGQGVASMDHHVGMKMERNREVEMDLEKMIRRDLRLDMPSSKAKRLGLDQEIDL